MSRSKFHGYAYDAVWTIALAVHSVVADRRGRYDGRSDGRQRLSTGIEPNRNRTRTVTFERSEQK